MYVDVLDVDSELNFELVVVFLIAIQPGDVVPGNNFTASRVFHGSFLVATMELSFQLECLPGFTGEECFQCVSPPCDVGSMCEPGNVTCITTDVIDRITTSSASALSQGNTDPIVLLVLSQTGSLLPPSSSNTPVEEVCSVLETCSKH